MFTPSVDLFGFSLRIAVVLAVVFAGGHWIVSPTGARELLEQPPIASILGTAVEYDRAVRLETGDASRAVAIGDLDGDGTAEVVTVIRTQPGIVIHQNVGGRRFTRLTPIPLGSSFVPELVYIHDLNQDGRPEIVVTYSFERAVTIFRNTSTGPGNITFAARADLATLGLQSHSVAFGDIDNDGKVDMLVSSRQVSSGISIFRNISGGSSEVQFASRVDILIAPPNWALALADLDADGKLDIITLGNETSRDMWVLRNISSGAGNISFASELVFDLPTSVWNYFPGDFDGDGKIDIAYTIANQSSIGIFRNTTAEPGAITLAAPQSFEVGLAPYWVIMKDFDLDGKPDMASVNSNGNSVTVRSNTSSPGSLSFATRDADFGGGLRTYHFDAGDIDGDGKPDIAIANLDEGTTSVLFNEGLINGKLRFKSRKDYITENRKGVRAVTVGDFNNDGNGDVAIGTDFRNGNSSLFVYSNSGQSEFTTAFANPSGSLSVVALETTDLDNDGRDDVVFLEPGATRFLRNVSDGSGPIAFALASTPTPLFPRDVRTGDLDGDGKDDLVIRGGETQTSPDSMVILRNISAGPGSVQFTVVRTMDFPENSYTISGIEDLDGDGLNDIVLNPSASSLSFIRILRNQGQFNFNTTDITNLPESLVNPGIGDLDGDGKPELVSGFRFSRSIYRNASTPGNIAFPVRVDIPNSILGEHHIADVDGDGRNDVISRRYSTIYGSFEVLRNTSGGIGHFSFEDAGRFAYGANYNATGNDSDTIVDDLNSDGRPDVVARFSGSNFGSFSVHLNQTNINRQGPFDFDGDRKTDISVFRPVGGSGSEWWYLRSSDGGNRAFAFGEATDTIVPGDFTGDGKTDIAFWRPASGEWFVLRSEDSTFFAFPFGAAGDVPSPADFDGDGKADATVFRTATNTWFTLRSSDGQVATTPFGIAGDRPVPADYDGDGKADVAVFRPTGGSGGGEWWYLRSSDGANRAFAFGSATDLTVPGDYTGDGKADLAYFRPTTGEWYVLRSEDSSFFAFPWGANGDVPAPGDYDGDGKTDAAVFRPSNSNWFALRSTAGPLILQFGTTGDRPVPNAFVR